MYAHTYLVKHAQRQEVTYMPKVTPVLKYYACWTREIFQESRACAMTIQKYLTSALIPSLLCCDCILCSKIIVIRRKHSKQLISASCWCFLDSGWSGPQLQSLLLRLGSWAQQYQMVLQTVGMEPAEAQQQPLKP